MSELSDKYPPLTTLFFKGGFIGQLRSVHRDRETRANKVEAFRSALEAGDLKFPLKLGRVDLHRLVELGIDLPPHLTPAGRERVAEGESSEKGRKVTS